ncbi:DUF6879 family protein [Actinomadura alba]|uniref:DUF6879 domain-containing protein n=1 Tax=Actinomadura alba TaxID=406431 RepID=A0ABR7LZ81_9ACTN|nr:DUF6879 family protein [Actinomadura alba]MBC6470162.1 hypothetical protein [Actinomadura alba]
MRPPAWALRESERLDLDEFSGWFSEAWSALTSRFLKLECRQDYREIETNESQAAYESGDIEKARELLRVEAEADRPLYEDVIKQSIDYARIRLVQEPLSPYLRYELISYEIRQAMGENIEVVRVPGELALPNEDYFDFLLFDRYVALIHDYGESGAQSGGWMTRHPGTIESLERTLLALRETAVPIDQYAR